MRVLVISNNSFSKTQNNGKTMSSILDFANKEDLAQLYFGTNEEPDLDICSNYYRITEIDIFKSIVKLKFRTKNTYNDTLKLNPDGDKTILKKIKNNAKTFALLRETLWELNTWKTNELFTWIEKFKPDLIFSVLGNGIFVHKITMFIARKYKIPFVSYFTDDYYINDNSTNILQKIHYKLLKNQYKKTMKQSSLIYVIGKKMKEDYRRVFKREIGVLVNCIDFADKIKYINRSSSSDRIIISYIGGLHLNRWKSIIDLSSLIDKIKLKHKLNIEINAFSALIPDEEIINEFNKHNIKYCGFLCPDKVNNQINVSDFLLHVESFEEKYRLYTKYSVSTKIPECLSSKKLLIVYGPHEVASIELVANNNLGCVLTDKNSKTKNLDLLEEFILNRNNKEEFIQRAYKYSYENFNKKNIQNQLLSDLNDLLNK